MTESGLPAKMVVLHDRLAAADLPHAFGGALALAWCTQQARGTIDIDLNVFVTVDRLDNVIGALPREIDVGDDDLALLTRDGQARLWWDTTPVDLFLNTSAFHERVGDRIRWEPFAGVTLPFLSCGDLAVFKAFFNRTRDWADLEAMRDAATLDIDAISDVLAAHLGADDDRIGRLRSLGP